MLSFAWISDVDVKRWFAFDSVDFPNFWHAWVRIGDYYYDPTFDDPVWDMVNNSRGFLYYKLPYDLMYVNRFDWLDIPKEYIWLDLKTRKKIVLKNMYDIYEKYKDYPLMAKVKNRIELWLKYDDDLTIDILKEKLPFYEVNNYVFYDKNWNKRIIISLNYVVLDQNNIDAIIDNILDSNFNLKDSKIFKWYDKSWNSEYRLAYNLKYY
jgi:hypothetical protein